MVEAAPYILLADQDQKLRSTLEQYSVTAGWRCDAVPDGGSLLSAVERNEYDVVVADYRMPGLCGADLLHALRERKPDRPVIVVSSSASIEDAVAALREGAVDYLLKPVDLEALKSAVERVVVGLRRQGVQDGAFNFIEAQSTAYRFRSLDVAEGRAPLFIAGSLCRSRLISLEQRLRLELAYQEAMANSLEHGNLELCSKLKDEYDASGMDCFSREKSVRLNDPLFAERHVLVRTRYARGKLTIVIQDEGPGFLPKERPITRAPKDLLLHGRGMTIITSIMDEVVYSRRGSRIKMVKYL